MTTTKAPLVLNRQGRRRLAKRKALPCVSRVGGRTNAAIKYAINSGQLGAGRIHTITSPVGSTTATTTYTYDADGHWASRSIDGSTESYSYTNTQLTNATNPLGSFTYNYDSASAIISNV